MEQFGLEQINDAHLSKLIFYPNSMDIFKDVAIADGISIVVKDMKKKESEFEYIYSESGYSHSVKMKSPGKDLMPLNPLNSSIVRKIKDVVKKREYGFLHDSVLSQKLFSIESDFVENNPSLVREYQEDDILSEDEIKLFTNDKAGKSGRAKWYIAKSNVINTGLEHLGRWKVVVSSANAGGQKRSNQIAIMDNRTAFGRSRVALKTFKTEQEARNFYAYCNSDFIRYTFLLTDESLTSLAKLVPDIFDYSNDNPLVNFKEDIDEQLYRLFEIDENIEQSFIKEVLIEKGH